MLTSLRQIYAMSAAEAQATAEEIGWPDGPYCPRCGCVDAYPIAERFKCKACYHFYTLTSGTQFSGRKASWQDIFAAAFIFTAAAKGISSIQHGLTLGLQQRSSWYLNTRFRQALWREVQRQTLQGVVEVDGAMFGGHVRLGNVGLRGKARTENQTVVRRYGRRCVIVVAKQRLGRTVPMIVQKESEAKAQLVRLIAPGSIIVTDGAKAWVSLADLYQHLKVEHAWSFAANGACTNNAESYFSGMRDMHDGIHNHMSLKYMPAYAAELAWKRDMVEMRMDHPTRLLALLKECFMRCESNHLSDVDGEAV